MAGVAGLCTTLLLRAVEHLTYHYSFGTLLTGVTGSSPVRRALGPMVGGALAWFGWWMPRRRTEVPALAETIAGHRRLPRLPLSLDAGLQVLLVGAGASLGREGAPRQFAAALGDFGTSRWSMTPRAFNQLMARARPATTINSWLPIPAIAAAGLLIGICSVWFQNCPATARAS